jgi:hypothetical protein
MTSRAQGSAAIVAARMAKSAEEMSHWSQYAYVVVNRGLAHSVAEIAALSPPSACAAPAKWGSPNSSTTSARDYRNRPDRPSLMLLLKPISMRGLFCSIAAARAPFVSRGDKSDTDALEKRLWRKAEIDPVARGDAWYRDIGGGMGAALNTASAMAAYTLSDRGTWLSFNNKGPLVIVVEGDPALLNRYDVILLDPAKHPAANHSAAGQLAEWLTSPEGQAAIGAYTIAGEQLFHPSAASPK